MAETVWSDGGWRNCASAAVVARSEAGACATVDRRMCGARLTHARSASRCFRDLTSQAGARDRAALRGRAFDRPNLERSRRTRSLAAHVSLCERVAVGWLNYSVFWRGRSSDHSQRKERQTSSAQIVRHDLQRQPNERRGPFLVLFRSARAATGSHQADTVLAAVGRSLLGPDAKRITGRPANPFWAAGEPCCAAAGVFPWIQRKGLSGSATPVGCGRATPIPTTMRAEHLNCKHLSLWSFCKVICRCRLPHVDVSDQGTCVQYLTLGMTHYGARKISCQYALIQPLGLFVAFSRAYAWPYTWPNLRIQNSRSDVRMRMYPTRNSSRNRKVVVPMEWRT
jgi:hypothetical protein